MPATLRRRSQQLDALYHNAQPAPPSDLASLYANSRQPPGPQSVRRTARPQLYNGLSTVQRLDDRSLAVAVGDDPVTQRMLRQPPQAPAVKKFNPYSDPASPLAGTAQLFQRLAEKDAARSLTENQDYARATAAHKNNVAATDAALVGNLPPLLLERSDDGAVDIQATATPIKNDMSDLGAMYALYQRETRGSAKKPNFNDFASAYFNQNPNELSRGTVAHLGLDPDVGQAAIKTGIDPNAALEKNRRDHFAQSQAREARRDQFNQDRSDVAAFQRYGILPAGANDLDQFALGLAMQGNPAARNYIGNQQALQAQAAQQQFAVQQKITAQQQQLELALNTAKAKLEFAASQPPSLAQQLEVQKEIAKFHPRTIADETYKRELKANLALRMDTADAQAKATKAAKIAADDAINAYEFLRDSASDQLRAFMPPIHNAPPVTTNDTQRNSLSALVEEDLRRQAEQKKRDDATAAFRKAQADKAKAEQRRGLRYYDEYELAQQDIRDAAALKKDYGAKKN